MTEIKAVDPANAAKTVGDMVREVLQAEDRAMSALALRHEIRRRFDRRVERPAVYAALNRLIQRNEVTPLDDCDGPRTFLRVPAPSEL